MSATSAPRPALWIALGLLVLSTIVLATLRPADPYQGLRHQQSTPPIEAAPMCPWREPQTDLRLFFPGATGSTAETRVLSGKRLELTRRLGRPPSAEENALHLFRIRAANALLGSLMVRRVKGEHGAIELVIATDPQGAIQGVRVQRQREPQATAEILHSGAWLGRFRGLSADQIRESEPFFHGVPREAHVSAAAVVDGVHTQLILLSVAEQSGAPAAPPHHH